MKAPLFIQVALLQLRDSSPGMSVQAEAVALSGEDESAAAVGCFSSTHAGWLLAVGNDGSAAIVRDEGGRPTVVKSLAPRSESVDLREPARIRGECLAAAAGTRLRLYLDDKLLLSVAGSKSPTFRIVALAAIGGSQPNGADVRFDEVLVRRR